MVPCADGGWACRSSAAPTPDGQRLDALIVSRDGALGAYDVELLPA